MHIDGNLGKTVMLFLQDENNEILKTCVSSKYREVFDEAFTEKYNFKKNLKKNPETERNWKQVRCKLENFL